MKINVSEYLTCNTILHHNYPYNFHTIADVEETNYEIQEEHYQILWNETWFDGIHINAVEIAASKEVDFYYESSIEHIGFFFCLKGKMDLYDASKTNHLLSLHQNKQYISIAQSEPVVINVVKNVTYIYIQLTASYFKQITNSAFTHLTKFEQDGITPEMKLWLKNLSNHRYQGRMKRIFLESKIFELIIFYLHKKNAPSLFLKEDDVRKIMLAKQLVENNLQRPSSLIELSRQAGINDFKLKKGFKALTGYTVFGYLYKLRMEKAHYLLLQEKKTVNEVAFLVGYKNAQHFITAFKKKYEISPGSLNKN
ncbi:helix-turn-helix transcriptional regulator [Pedobacter sp. R20-19]|uniref:helix-turn-helix transcriptional regulator n=1 Tax=Pedobacter sp. R20-19 TaxID=1270196 RepID=UPI00068EE800|nr:AraC family transcriptional regulator [Pedobacter sp. R20-19]